MEEKDLFKIGGEKLTSRLLLRERLATQARSDLLTASISALPKLKSLVLKKFIFQNTTKVSTSRVLKLRSTRSKGLRK